MLDATAVFERLKQFDIPDDDARKSQLFKAEYLTPDSWAYIVVRRGRPAKASKFFVLYTEDFIQSLDYIQEVVEDWSSAKLVSFIPPKQPVKFEESAAYQYYPKPDKAEIEKWMPYALPDYGNYTFLLKVEPTTENISYWAESHR